jgi:N6-L-threonylcarbamoyladenine synthase
LQETITKILIDKIIQASKNTGIKNIVFGGGVSANSRIRESANRELKNFKLFFPKIEYTTDNAAMIAVVGYLKYREKKFTDYGIESKARYKI